MIKKTIAMLGCVLMTQAVMIAPAAADYEVRVRVPGLVYQPSTYTPGSADSCRAVKQRVPKAASGVYEITVGGMPLKVLCDMESAGGGWTLVLAQYETNPVSWAGGVPVGFEPALTGTSFALGASQLPPHTQVAFGKDDVATHVEYFDHPYSAGPIPVTTLTGRKTGLAFQLHRLPNNYYAGHDPESGSTSSSARWNNTLAVDQIGVRYSFHWAFSPNAIQSNRGYGMSGQDLQGKSDSHAWTVWVR